MRLLILTEKLPCGIGETFLRPELNAIARQGVELRILPVFPQEGRSDAPELLEYTWNCSGLRRRQVYLGGLMGLTGSEVGRALGRIALRESTSLESLKNNLLSFGKAYAWMDRVAEWGPDHIHAHWATYPAAMAMCFSRMLGIPWSLTAHRFDIAKNDMLAAKANDATFVRLVSDRNRDALHDILGGTGPRTELVLPLGVEVPERGGAMRPPRSTSARFRVMCAANLVPVKGHEFLFRAIASLRESQVRFELLLAGEGWLRKRLESLAQELGVEERIKFLGRVPHSELLNMYSCGEVDCVVLPSVELGSGVYEGFGVALLEAMARGIPVIGTRSGGIPSILGAGGGILVPERDFSALARAIKELATDPDSWERLRLEGRRTVEDRFDADVVAEELLGFLP